MRHHIIFIFNTKRPILSLFLVMCCKKKFERLSEEPRWNSPGNHRHNIPTFLLSFQYPHTNNQLKINLPISRRQSTTNKHFPCHGTFWSFWPLQYLGFRVYLTRELWVKGIAWPRRNWCMASIPITIQHRIWLLIGLWSIPLKWVRLYQLWDLWR